VSTRGLTGSLHLENHKQDVTITSRWKQSGLVLHRTVIIYCSPRKNPRRRRHHSIASQLAGVTAARQRDDEPEDASSAVIYPLLLFPCAVQEMTR
jgi:hypothetical protein